MKRAATRSAPFVFVSIFVVVSVSVFVFLPSCSSTPAELTLDILLPAKRQLFAAVTKLDLTATRDGAVLSHSTLAASTQSVSLEGVSHGARTIVQLDGTDSSGTVLAQGRTCPFTFDGPNTTAPLYFAPTNFFAPTAGAPLSARTSPVAMALSDGHVLLAGGANAASIPLATSELFTPGAATFGANAAVMNHARRRAEGTPIASLGLLVTGGIDANGTVADAEVYLESSQQFVAVKSALLDARVGHRAVLLPDGRTFVSGGAPIENGVPLATTLFIFVTMDGNSSVTAGTGTLAEARRDHAATVAVGIPLVFGGYGTTGAPLDSIEAVDPATGGGTIIAHLQTARADATASLLSDGSILIVGGKDAHGDPIANAELYNPITRATTLVLGAARYGHTATVLVDGRVLVAGGIGANNVALASVELYVPGLGFVSERELGTARAGHVTVLLCDGTALVVGGGADAELYAGPAN